MQGPGGLTFAYVKPMVPYGLGFEIGRAPDVPPPPGDPMKTVDASRCAVCGARAADETRLLVEQDRHFDCPRRHQVGLCPEHGAAVRDGRLAVQEVLYDWVQKHHDELYDGTRLYIAPRLTCLRCNEPFVTNEERHACAKCGAINVLGTALGSPAAVRLETT